MRRFLWFSTFILFISGAVAQTGGSSKAAPRKAISKKASASARVTSQEVQELRDALAAQQRQSEEQRQQLEQLKSQLQQLLDATQQASASAQKVQGSAEQAQATAAQAQQSAAEAQRQADQVSSSVTEARTALALVDKQSKDENKRLSALQEALGRFRFVGDIRFDESRGRPEIARERAASRDIDVRDDDFRAPLDEHARGALAQARSAARDEEHVALNSHARPWARTPWHGAGIARCDRAAAVYRPRGSSTAARGAPRRARGSPRCRLLRRSRRS